MNSKIILFTLMIFSSTTFANFFVGVDGGFNKSRQTGVGDLPMAREEFEVNSYKTSDDDEVDRIENDILDNGGTDKDFLAAIKHLMSMRLVYKPGFNFKVHGGYKFKYINAGISYQYINYSYKHIMAVDDSTEQVSIFWKAGNMSGKTAIHTGLAFVEYEINKLSFYRFTPIVGAGLGFANVKDKLTSNDETKERSQVVFAYQFKLGLNFTITKNFTATLDGVYFGTSEVKATNYKIKQGQLNLGVRYRFN
ncbi:MAG: porin family protein [Flavobacteriaceae bacterium]|nr:porin family protein [Flavobacteriaceae bacterium]